MNTLFYKLEREYEPELVGVKDACAQAELVKKSFIDKKKYDEYLNYFLSYRKELFYNQTKLPPFDFDFEYVKLKKDAKLTDFLYFGPSLYHKYLVSEKVQEILKGFELPTFKYYNAKLYTKTEFTDEYKFFYSPSIDYGFVDFKESRFSTGDNIIGKKHLEIHSLEELLAVGLPINKEKIVLNNFDSTLDYFKLLIYPDPIISEKLRNEFTKQKVTGIRMIKLTENEFEIL